MTGRTEPRSPDTASGGLTRTLAGRAAGAEPLPTALRAVLGYYADTGRLSLTALRLRRTVDRAVSEIVAEAFALVEEAIADRIDAAPPDVAFTYDTKLTLPAELTLGQIYYRAKRTTPENFDPVREDVRTPLVASLRPPYGGGDERNRRQRLAERSEAHLDAIAVGEAVTELVVVALIDGDMRDALNDDELADFEVDFPVASDRVRRRIAECAQTVLEDRVETLFDGFDPAIREAYDRAVAVSERHQDRDAAFRDLARRARRGDDEARDEIRTAYKLAEFDDRPGVFDDRDLELPYLVTQYRRVGVIYRGMIEMYRAAGVEVDPMFEKSIILSIIGAQVWLDDVDDYRADHAEDQLTPVTAEYLLASTDADARREVVRIAGQYLDAAKHYASASNSPLAGIGSDYIYRSGDPSVLPQ